MARRPGAQAALVFLVALVVYNANLRYIASFDGLASSLIPFRILSGHGLTLAEPRGIPREIAYSIVRGRSGSFVPIYPVVTPLLVTPLYVPAAVWVARGGNPEIARVLMEKFAASAVAAASVAVLFFVLARLTRPRLALLLAGAYAFGTTTWAISSQALWQHAAGGLLMALVLLFLVRDDEAPAALALFGLTAGLLAANRPTEIVFVAPVAFLVVRHLGRRAWPFLAACGGASALALAWNLAQFGNALGGYGLMFGPDGRALGHTGTGLEGFLGLLFSNRGLFFFSPFALLVFGYRPRTERVRGLSLLLAAYGVSLWINGRTYDWSGGYCYGTRYVLGGLPVLFVAIVEPLERAWRARVGRGLVFAAVGIAVLLEVAGAFFYPRGDSGNAGYGLYTLRNASPVRALAAGPAPPDFLGLLVPRLATRGPLSVPESAVRYAWEAEPPARWSPAERHRLAARVTNSGPVSWKGLGGFMNEGGVRLIVRWKRGAASGEIVSEEMHWAFLRLKSGESASVSFDVEAPAEEGSFVLEVELGQLGSGGFSARGFVPLERAAAVRRVDDGLAWTIEGPDTVTSWGSAPFRVALRGALPAGDVGLAWRWRRPNGDVVTRGGPVAIETTTDGGRATPIVRGDLVSGDYLLEFGLVGRDPALVVRAGPPRRERVRGWTSLVLDWRGVPGIR